MPRSATPRAPLPKGRPTNHHRPPRNLRWENQTSECRSIASDPSIECCQPGLDRPKGPLSNVIPRFVRHVNQPCVDGVELRLGVHSEPKSDGYSDHGSATVVENNSPENGLSRHLVPQTPRIRKGDMPEELLADLRERLRQERNLPEAVQRKEDIRREIKLHLCKSLDRKTRHVKRHLDGGPKEPATGSPSTSVGSQTRQAIDSSGGDDAGWTRSPPPPEEPAVKEALAKQQSKKRLGKKPIAMAASPPSSINSRSTQPVPATQFTEPRRAPPPPRVRRIQVGLAKLLVPANMFEMSPREKIAETANESAGPPINSGPVDLALIEFQEKHGPGPGEKGWIDPRSLPKRSREYVARRRSDIGEWMERIGDERTARRDPAGPPPGFL